MAAPSGSSAPAGPSPAAPAAGRGRSSAPAPPQTCTPWRLRRITARSWPATTAPYSRRPTWTAAGNVEDDLFALTFTDGRHGWAGGGAAFGEAPADFARTDDGGVSWTWSELPAWGRVRGLSTTDGQTGWAAVEDWGIDGDRPQGSVYMTADGGASWVRQVTTSQVLLGVTMASDGTGWAWGEAGTVLRTADGGASWRQLDAGTDADIYAAVARRAGGVWLAGGGGAVIAGTPAN